MNWGKNYYLFRFEYHNPVVNDRSVCRGRASLGTPNLPLCTSLAFCSHLIRQFPWRTPARATGHAESKSRTDSGSPAHGGGEEAEPPNLIELNPLLIRHLTADFKTIHNSTR